MATVVQQPKKNPWGPKPVVRPVLLAEIQREELLQQDEILARRLQDQEDKKLRELVAEAVFEVPEPEAQVEQEEDASATAAQEAADLQQAIAIADNTTDDAVLAALLQLEFDQEHDRQITIREKLANISGDKVSISMANLRRCAQTSVEAEEEDYDAAYCDEECDMETAPGKTYDKTRRVFRDKTGEIITKHNAAASMVKNRQRMQEMHIATGDIEGSGDLVISNRVVNSLKSFADRSNKSRLRLHELKEFSTSDMALDANTRLIVFKMINSGALETLHGSISSGKESVVFVGQRRTDPEDLTSPLIECAVKIFKTTLTEFKERAQFLTGDRRYEKRAGKQHTRHLVKMWAEKEMSNLIRMRNAGIACPEAFLQKKHVLVMSFVGTDGSPAPKLREAGLSQPQLATAYAQICQLMKKLYNDCRLVHADLSEYNILYHNNEPWLIDVGQAVEVTHARANEYFYNDCRHITDFFLKNGVEGIRSAVQLFNYVTGHSISSAEVSSLTSHIKMTRKEIRNEQGEDVSNVCLQPARLHDDYARNNKGENFAEEFGGDDVEGDEDDWCTIEDDDDDDEELEDGADVDDEEELSDLILAIKQASE